MTQAHAPADLSVTGAEAGSAAQALGVVRPQGLRAAEARPRLESHGRNELATAKDESPVLAFLGQYSDFMQIVLLGVAVVSLFVTGVTTIDIFERVFGTTELTGDQWAICLGLAASLLVIEEVIKFFLRRREPGAPSGTAPAVVTPLPATA